MIDIHAQWQADRPMVKAGREPVFVPGSCQIVRAPVIGTGAEYGAGLDYPQQPEQHDRDDDRHDQGDDGIDGHRPPYEL